MIKSGVDQEAIVKMFAEASAKQGEALRKGVGEATLKALQTRELTMDNIKKVLKTVTASATVGAAQNKSSPVDIEALLTKAFAGMDSALLQAVEAHRKALQQFVDQGEGLQAKQLKTALSNLEKMEDTFFDTVTKAVQGVGSVPMQGPWDQVLGAMRTKGTDSGARAANAVEQLLAQTRTALREGRAATTRTAQTMIDGYAALVSGVLIGMSQGLQGGSSPAPSPAKKR